MWPGSSYTYLIFSISFTSLLCFMLKKRISSGYAFFVAALWIGYWLKLSMHIINPTLPWMEPTGLFDFTKAAWDQVAFISSVGSLGVLTGGFIHLLVLKKTSFIIKVNKKTVASTNIWWLAGLFTIIAVVVLNESFHIVHASIPPVHMGLPFHLQGLFGWCVGGGVFLVLMIPFYQSVFAGHFIRATVFLILASVLIGVSIFSRGTVVFQSIIIFVALFVYHDLLPKITLKQGLISLMIVITGVLLSATISQTRREIFIASVQPASVQPASVQLASAQPASVQPTFSKYSLFLLLKLPIERWIGLEGVMAISAHPIKSNKLLWSAIEERRAIGSLDTYTRDIALSSSKDTKTIMYATPPGVFSFWYYSGSLLIVFLASTLLTLIMVSIESILLISSDNPFLSSAVGVGIALQMIHMGTGGLLIPAIITFTTFIFALIVGNFSKIKLRLR